MSTVELSRELGVGKNAVKEWLDGSRRPREAKLGRLAEVLGEPVELLTDPTDLDELVPGIVPPLGRLQAALCAAPQDVHGEALQLLDAVAAMLERAAARE